MNIITQGVSDLLFATLRVIGSALTGPHNAVTIGVQGIGGFDDTDQTSGNENNPDAEAYGAPGIVWRPRPPEEVDGQKLGAEARGVRTSDGIEPWTWRDLRWHRKFPSPKEGSQAFVHYGGGFLAFDDADVPPVDAGAGDPPGLRVKESRYTSYFPYGTRKDGTATKAMAIVADPEQRSLTFVHGDGYAVVLSDEGVLLRSKTGKSWALLADDKFQVVADTISLQGNVALGANTAAAMPLLPGPASQPTPSVFFSPI